MEGAAFGRYRLVALLGRGGMGEVWRAYDTATDRTVAVKLLPPGLADDDTFVQRFRREAHAAARLNSPHVIPIHSYGEIDGRLYVDMRLIEGRDLQAVLEDGPLEPGRAVRIIEQVAKALQAAHRVGLIHRDVKPSNILLDEDDFAYLIDFGIAHATQDTRLTNTGGMVGTLHYLAPERFGSGEVDARADIYALACVLYECLTGGPPFPADSTERLIVAHLSAPPPQPSAERPDVPEKLDDVVATGMAKDPDQRYATTVELAGAARDAITAPIRRPGTARAAPTRPAAPVMPTEHTWGFGRPGPDQPEGGEPTRWASPAPGQDVVPPAQWVAGAARPRSRTGWIVGGVVAVVVLVAALVAVVVFVGHRASRPSRAAPASTQAAPTSIPPAHTTYSSQVVAATGIISPGGVAVDASGDLYVTGSSNNVVNVPAGASTQTVLPFIDLVSPAGVAVDAAGDVYVADWGNNRVAKLTAGALVPTVLPFSGLQGPFGVAVDAAGNVYVADNGNDRVVKLPAGATAQTVLPFSGLSTPHGVCVDAAGNVYATDYGNNRVLKLPPGATTASVLPFSNLRSPWGVATDAAGNVSVVDYGNTRVLRLAAGATTQTALPFSGLKSVGGVAIDAAGDVYVADTDNNRIVKLPTG
jgi:serine/threonine-protein kinase